MCRLNRSLARLGVVAVICAAVTVSAHAEIIDRVLAVVAGELIMMSDVRAARDLGLADAGQATDPDRAILSQLIDRALVLNEVDRYAPPEPALEEIERAFGAVRARFNSAQDLEAAMARVGLDTPQLRDVLRQDLRIRAYLEQRFAAETPARTQEVVTEWIAGLRRRADIIDLYVPAP